MEGWGEIKYSIAMILILTSCVSKPIDDIGRFRRDICIYSGDKWVKIKNRWDCIKGRHND